MSVEAPRQVVDELPVENTTDVVPRQALFEPSDDAILDNVGAEPKRAFEAPQTEPVSPEDAENRYADHEILGKSVRVKLSIIETAKNAVSVSDETLAEGLNRLSPRAAWRKFRLDRAQKSLNSKEDRLSSKHQKAQESYEEHKKKLESRLEKKKTADQEKWVDGVTSTRLRERRQEKVDARH